MVSSAPEYHTRELCAEYAVTPGLESILLSQRNLLTEMERISKYGSISPLPLTLECIYLQ